MLFEKLDEFDIILGSASPRRKQLLEEMGLKFRVHAQAVDESIQAGISPFQAAEYLSLVKVNAYSKSDFEPNSLIITADTIVTIDDEILGKPSDKKDAFQMLKKLSGRSHQVITGVTIKTLTKEVTFSVSTEVRFKNLTEEEINYYVDHFEPYDKAGAYGIQEWIGHVAIEWIRGSYYNVMGLPTHRLYEELLKF